MKLEQLETVYSIEAMRKPPTLEDLAKTVGMSKATVSMALNGKTCIAEETRKRIEAVAKEIGYETNILAQNWSKGRCLNNISIFSLHFDTGVRADKIAVIQREFMSQGFDVPLYNCLGKGDLRQKQFEIARTLRRQKPRAIVVYCTYSREDILPETLNELKRYQQEGGILVSFDHPFPIECDQVIFDREENTYQATLHLLKLGHRDIGFCRRGRDSQHPRLKGFLRAMEEYKIPVRQEWMFLEYRSHLEFGSEIATKFLELKEKPTALCIVNDMAATIFLNHILRNGYKVPDDLSIVSHDDTVEAKHAMVPISSISQPVKAIAINVVEMLSHRIQTEDKSPYRKTVLNGDLAVRQSSAAPSAAKKN